MVIRDSISQDFEITIKKPGPEYPVRVSSPAGSATGAFVLPFSVDRIEQALQNFREGIPFGRYRSRMTGRIQDILSPEGFGSALFQALFRDEVLAIYRESLSIIRKPGVASRMSVKLNITARELAHLPWELLYDPEGDDFLSFGKETPVIRFVECESKSYTFDPPLRVLLVSANPAGTALLDLEHERKVIGEALDTLKRGDKVVIDHLFGATIRELRSKIRGHEPHVIHFMGHGQVNRLLLEDIEEKGLSLAESSLGIILRNASSLRMVVLNACETARPAESEERLGLAHGLARRGVPAIVAMQFEISDEAACEFAGELYRVLAEGGGVDEAVFWGRIAVQNRFFEDMEWATPVLYMQAPEGRIFDDLLRGPETKVRMDDPSAIRKEQVEILQKRLRIHERNLWRLQEQKAKHGIMVPSIIEYSIDEEQIAINQILEELKQLDKDKKIPEPQERPAVGIADAYQEGATVDMKRRLADIVVTEKEPPDPRLLEQVQIYYEQGLRYFDQGEWDWAIAFLEEVRRLAPGHRDVHRLVRTAREELTKQETERRTQEKLAALYKQALMYCDEERWQAAIDLFNEILGIDLNYRDVRVRIEEARQAHTQRLVEERTRLKLEILYQRTQEFLVSKDWERAIRLLEQIVQIDREYADASAQLAEAQRQKQLAELYTRGEEAFIAQDWEQAVSNFGAAFAIDKSYKDVGSKLERARQQHRWDALYQEGLEYLEDEHWDEAVEALRKVQLDQKRRKDVRVARLYAEGRQCVAQEEWEPALARFEEIIAENPRYRDAAGQLQEVRRQKRLHDLYTEGLKQAKAQEWRQATRALEQVAREVPNYRDAQHQLNLAREEAELAERYASGKRFFDLGRWSEAIRDFQAIVQVRSDYLNVQRMVEEATQEQELAESYAEGMLLLNQGQWQEAIDAFEKLVGIAPDYRDAARQLDLARRKNSLINAYMDGKACYEQKDWAGAIHHLEQVMHYEEKGYLDAAILLAEAKRQGRLAQLYQKGMDCLATENWDKALSYFEQVVELDQNYRDTATQLAGAQLQKRLVDTYADAEKLMEVEQWEDAATKFQQILAEVSDYRNARALLAEVQRQHRLAALYEAANQAYEEGRWTEAITHFKQIGVEEAKYRDVKEKLAEAQRQQKLKELYERGMAYLGRGEWEGAISVLEAAVKEDSDYKDAFVKLSEARRQQTLASHYDEGARCMAEERWDGAIAAFEKVVGIDSRYRDVEARLDEANRQKKLAELYAAGEKYLASKQWEQAIECFRRIQEIDEDYKDASRKLGKAAHERNLESLHGQGMRFFNAGKWTEALESWNKLLALEPTYRDVAAIVKEVERRKTLDDAYAVGIASLTARAWEEAVTAFEKIIEIEADCQDARNLLQKAEQGRWADWESRMLSSLQDSGRLTADSLDYVPERFRLDIMQSFYEEHSENLELVPSTDFQVLTLPDFDLVLALRKTLGAMLKAIQSEQTGATESRSAFWVQLKRITLFGSEPTKSFDVLVDEFADQLCNALGFVRAPDPNGDHQHKQLYARMIRTPTLHYKLPYRFPLIIFAKQSVEASDVRDLLDLLGILERTIEFAFLVTLGNADQLKMLLDQEVSEHDFVVLSQYNLEQILLSRDKVGQLTQTILEQVNLTVISPYRIAGPVPERMFFGREKEIKAIRDAIRDTSVALTGGRKIGKTSILQKVQRILAAELDYKTLHLDCHTVDTHEELFELLTEKLSEQLREPPKTFRQAIKTMRAVEDELIIVLLDEVDDLLQYDAEKRGEKLFKEFRSLSQEGYCNFVFCGGKTLYKRIHNPDSPFFNFCHNVVLHFLNEESAAWIITKPMRDMGIELKNQDGIVAQILEVSSCHPSIVQLICMKLVENIKERIITLDNLHEVITGEDFYTGFKEIAWGQATPLEKIVSLAFVEDESFTASRVYQRLAEFGIEDRDAIDDALDTLELYSLITKRGKRYEYALKVFPRIIRETEDTKTLIDSFVRQISKEA